MDGKHSGEELIPPQNCLQNQFELDSGHFGGFDQNRLDTPVISGFVQHDRRLVEARRIVFAITPAYPIRFDAGALVTRIRAPVGYSGTIDTSA